MSDELQFVEVFDFPSQRQTEVRRTSLNLFGNNHTALSSRTLRIRVE